jgi:DNA-binding MarR family transcriptional regulator
MDANLNKNLANRLHSVAIHLLRGLRPQDDLAGISARRLSALSVIIFAGPLSLSNLAEIEQVSLPTTSRMMKDMEYEGLVERIADPDDKRSSRIQSTAKGQALFAEARQRRIQAITDRITALSPDQINLLQQAIPALEQMILPPNHPHLKG